MFVTSGIKFITCMRCEISANSGEVVVARLAHSQTPSPATRCVSLTGLILWWPRVRPPGAISIYWTKMDIFPAIRGTSWAALIFQRHPL